MTAVVTVVAVVALVAAYITWTAGRVDRLHARVDAARAVLDAQLVRRAAAAQMLAGWAATHDALPADAAAELTRAARAARESEDAGREAAENDLGRALHAALGTPQRRLDDEGRALLAEVETASTRVGFARQFHNSAVNDTRALRFRAVPRLLRLGAGRPMPTYFEIDDTALPGATVSDRPDLASGA